MIVEIKMYTNEKPKVKCVKCFSTNGNMILLVSDNIQYFNTDSNFYSIKMNDVKCIEVYIPKCTYYGINFSTMPAYEFMMNSKNFVDPNTINFDKLFNVTFLEACLNPYKYRDTISEIIILPTDNDLSFNMKKINSDNIETSTDIDWGDFSKPFSFDHPISISTPPIMPVPEPTYVSIYDKLDNIEKKLDYIIDKIGG